MDSAHGRTPASLSLGGQGTVSSLHHGPAMACGSVSLVILSAAFRTAPMGSFRKSVSPSPQGGGLEIQAGNFGWRAGSLPQGLRDLTGLPFCRFFIGDGKTRLILTGR